MARPSRPAFKDLFSRQAAGYAKFRPVYPDSLFRYLARLAPSRDAAWDCATGNGQAALKLARYFKRVAATDAAEKQLANAPRHSKIEYRRAAAEASGLPDRSVDLITVAQAFHWFRQEEFFAQAKRVLKPRGVLAFWCYELAEISPAVDAVILDFYRNTLSGCWEGERRLVEEGYAGVGLPFKEVSPPRFTMTARWTRGQLLGYLRTWSAVQTYIQKRGRDPVDALGPALKRAWGRASTRTARWELALRVGLVSDGHM